MPAWMGVRSDMQAASRPNDIVDLLHAHWLLAVHHIQRSDGWKIIPAGLLNE